MFVSILLVSHVQLMSSICKTSPDPVKSGPDPGLLVSQKTSATKSMKGKRRAVKLSKIFIQNNFWNLLCLRYRAPDPGFGQNRILKINVMTKTGYSGYSTAIFNPMLWNTGPLNVPTGPEPDIRSSTFCSVILITILLLSFQSYK